MSLDSKLQVNQQRHLHLVISPLSLHLIEPPRLRRVQVVLRLVPDRRSSLQLNLPLAFSVFLVKQARNRMVSSDLLLHLHLRHTPKATSNMSKPW